MLAKELTSSARKEAAVAFPHSSCTRYQNGSDASRIFRFPPVQASLSTKTSVNLRHASVQSAHIRVGTVAIKVFINPKKLEILLAFEFSSPTYEISLGVLKCAGGHFIV